MKRGPAVGTGSHDVTADGGFTVQETTIADIHAAYRTGALTTRALVEAYLERIEAYDRNGPAINSIISIDRTRR